MARRPRSRIRSRPRVAIIVETSMASGREIVKGIARYARENGPWSVYYEPGHFQESVPNWLWRWQGEGIIARVRNRQIAEAMTATGLPVVDVLGNISETKIPVVQVDDQAVAELAATHLAERGFRHFGHCSVRGPAWAQRRRDAFVARITASGRTCATYQQPALQTKAWFSEKERQRLADWIQQLPKPVGIMACNDTAGQKVLEACRQAGVIVPEEVAVLGVDNDEALCEIADPMLSSIIPVHDRVGYHAAELLDRMMQGARAPTEPLFLKPTNIVVRRSTDVLAIDDRDVAAAVRFIREHACSGIGVEQVVRHVSISYSTLRRRFLQILSRSIHDEILRVRLERSQELLADTGLSLARIAVVTGFEHQEYFGAVFRTKLGLTPKQFRDEARRTGSSGRFSG